MLSNGLYRVTDDGQSQHTLLSPLEQSRGMSSSTKREAPNHDGRCPFCKLQNEKYTRWRYERRLSKVTPVMFNSNRIEQQQQD